jgi:hypothetical protein
MNIYSPLKNRKCALPDCDKLVTNWRWSCCCKSHIAKYAAKKKHGTLGLPNKPHYVKKNKNLKTLNGSAQQKASMLYQRRKRQATPKWVNKDYINLIYENCRSMSIQQGINYEVDHIVPLKGETVCGLHVPWNLQIITEKDNGKKRNKH